MNSYPIVLVRYILCAVELAVLHIRKWVLGFRASVGIVIKIKVVALAMSTSVCTNSMMREKQGEVLLLMRFLLAVQSSLEDSVK